MAGALAGRVFFVTGGASGIGLSVAKTLLSRGASIGLCDNNKEKLETITSLVDESQKTRVITRLVNVANRSAVKDFLEATKSRFGKLHGVANIAGTGGRFIGTHNIWELPSEEYDFVMDTNVRSIFNTMAEALKPGFMETPASIVNVGSMFSQRGFSKAAPYSCSKHAIIGLTKSAAIEAGTQGIRVNAVLPYVYDDICRLFLYRAKSNARLQWIC